MHLKIERPPGYDGIGCRVRLVKAVFSKLLYLIEDLHGNADVLALFGSALGEHVNLRIHLSLDLLTHGSAQNISTA